MPLRTSALPMSHEVYGVLQLMSLACRRLLRIMRWGLLIIPPFWGRKEPCSFGPVLATPKLLSRLDHFSCGSGPGLSGMGCYGACNVGNVIWGLEESFRRPSRYMWSGGGWLHLVCGAGKLR